MRHDCTTTSVAYRRRLMANFTGSRPWQLAPTWRRHFRVQARHHLAIQQFLLCSDLVGHAGPSAGVWGNRVIDIDVVGEISRLAISASDERLDGRPR